MFYDIVEQKKGFQEDEEVEKIFPKILVYGFGPKLAISGCVFQVWVKITYNHGQKSLGQYCNMHIFPSFFGSLLRQCIIFKIFLQFSLPPPYTKLKLRKNSGYMRPTLFLG